MPPRASASYPRAVDHAHPGAARSRRAATRPSRRPAHTAPAAPSTRTAARARSTSCSIAAVDEAARLLDADGAMVYLVDPATGHLRFAHDAGIRSRRSREWVRSIDLPVGVGHVRAGRRRARRSS